MLLLAQGRGRHRTFDYADKLCGSLQRSDASGFFYRTGNPPGILFFSVFKKDPGKFFRRIGIHNVISRQCRRPVHPHVKRGILHKGKAPFRFIQLW